MNFEWSDELLSLRKDAVAFGREVLSAGAQEDDRASRFPVDRWRRLSEWGYFGLAVPTPYGGAGMLPLDALLITEGLGEGCSDAGLLFSAAVQAWVVIPALLKFGTEEQKERCPPPLVAGEAIGAFAITEPDSGSDAFAMRTTARRVDDDGYSISGRKAFITNGPVADLVVCFAATGKGGALGGTTAFVIEHGTRGF